MHRVDLARMHAGQPIRSTHRVKDAALEGGRSDVGELLHAEEHGLVLRRPIGLALLHEVGDRWKRAVVDGGLDVEHADRVLDQLALPDA